MRFRRPLKVLYALQYAQSMPHGAYSDARAILFQSRALQPPERRQDKHGLRRTAKRPVPTLAAADIAAASATRSAAGRVQLVCAAPPTRDTETPAFIAGRMPALNKSVSRKIWPSVIEITFVGTKAVTSPACVSITGSAVSEPLLPITAPFVNRST